MATRRIHITLESPVQSFQVGRSKLSQGLADARAGFLEEMAGLGFREMEW